MCINDLSFLIWLVHNQKERGFHPAPLLLSLSEHISIAELVFRREQIPCIAFVIEVIGEITHHVIQIVAFIDVHLGKILFRIVFAYVTILCIGDTIISCTFVVSIENQALILIQLTVF